MQLTPFLVSCAITSASYSLAYPSLGNLDHLVKRDDPFPWQGVPAGGVRAPCPGMNTLANHGYINRNGSNLTVGAVQAGFLAAFNVHPNVTLGGANAAISICSKATNTTCKAFSLDQLNAPHNLEHDASLTRDDYEMAFNITGDNHSFNATIWNMTKAFYGGATYIDITHANVARAGRVNQSQAQDAPGWFIEAATNSRTENAFFLSTMNDPLMNQSVTNPLARLAWIDYWFSNQRLPTDIGWVKPTSVITPAQISSIANAMASAATTLPPSTTTTSANATSSSSVSSSATSFVSTSFTNTTTTTSSSSSTIIFANSTTTSSFTTTSTSSRSSTTSSKSSTSSSKSSTSSVRSSISSIKSTISSAKSTTISTKPSTTSSKSSTTSAKSSTTSSKTSTTSSKSSTTSAKPSSTTSKPTTTSKPSSSSSPSSSHSSTHPSNSTSTTSATLSLNTTTRLTTTATSTLGSKAIRNPKVNPVPISAVPALVANPHAASAVSQAAAIATAAAPAPPVIPDMYGGDGISVKELRALEEKVKGYVEGVQARFGAALGDIL